MAANQGRIPMGSRWRIPGRARPHGRIRALELDEPGTAIPAPQVCPVTMGESWASVASRLALLAGGRPVQAHGPPVPDSLMARAARWETYQDFGQTPGSYRHPAGWPWRERPCQPPPRSGSWHADLQPRDRIVDHFLQGKSHASCTAKHPSGDGCRSMTGQCQCSRPSLIAGAATGFAPGRVPGCQPPTLPGRR